MGFSDEATSWAMDLWDTKLGAALGQCSAVLDGKGVTCGSQYMLTPVAKCEWAN